MIVDLHCHTQAYSGCAVDPLEDMVEAAIGRGLDALCVTEHEIVYPASRAHAETSTRLNGMALFRGVEISCYGPNDIMAHIVVLGSEDLEGPCYHPRELERLAREQEAALILAHPFRYSDGAHTILRHLAVDAIEVDSCNVDARAAAQADELARTLRIPRVAGSDAHRACNVGLCATRLEAPARSVNELVGQIRAGRVRPVHWNADAADWE